jgi:RNA polymerase primary sigma factor
MSASADQPQVIDASASRIGRALSSLTDDFHRQGGSLHQAQVDRTIEKRHLTPDEAVLLHRELRRLGISVLSSIAASPVAHAPAATRSRTIAHEDQPTAVNRLLDDPRCQKFLTEEQEIELGRAVQLGREMKASLSKGLAVSPESLAVVERGRKARERMIVSNIRLVAQHAFSHARATGLAPEDLLHDGLFGLMRAVDGFDHTAGFRFSTYATWWIRQTITRAIDDTGPLVRVPVHCAEAVRKLKRAQRRLERQSDGSAAKLKDLENELNWDPARIRFLQEVGNLRPVSFDHSVFDDDGDSQWSLIPDPRPGPEEFAEDEDTRKHIAEVLRFLPKRTAEIMKMRFGLDGDPPKTLEEIGQIYSLTRERVRQLEVKGLKAMRFRRPNMVNMHDLRDQDDPLEDIGEEE